MDGGGHQAATFDEAALRAAVAAAIAANPKAVADFKSGQGRGEDGDRRAR